MLRYEADRNCDTTFAHTLLFACAISFLGCVHSTPPIPLPHEPYQEALGSLQVQARAAATRWVYQSPPQGFLKGMGRGAARGAIIGFNVSREFDRAMDPRTAEMLRNCDSRRCGQAIVGGNVVVSVFQNLFVTPIVTVASGIQAGFTSLSESELREWNETIERSIEPSSLHGPLIGKLQESILSWCRVLQLPSPLKGNENLLNEQPDSLLELSIIEVGLGEVYPMPESDTEAHGINPHMVKPLSNLSSGIFARPRASLYMIVQTRLIRVSDGRILDERLFGHESRAFIYADWTVDDGARLKSEIVNSHHEIADKITRSLILPTLRRGLIH